MTNRAFVAWTVIILYTGRFINYTLTPFFHLIIFVSSDSNLNNENSYLNQATLLKYLVDTKHFMHLKIIWSLFFKYNILYFKNFKNQILKKIALMKEKKGDGHAWKIVLCQPMLYNVTLMLWVNVPQKCKMCVYCFRRPN